MSPKKLVRYFLRGCLVLVPLAVTAYIIFFSLKAVDELLPIGIPGAGILVTAAFITIVGFLTSNVIGSSVIELAEKVLRRLPLVKLIYTSIKDLMGAFVGDKKGFNQPVAVALVPDGSIRALGFITRDGLQAMGMPEHVAVYFPQSYNFAGNVVVVQKDRVELLALASSEVMTFIVSGGVSGFGVGKSVLPPPNAPPEP